MEKLSEAEKLCIEVLNWSENSMRASDFDTSFVESVLGQLYERDSVTDKQVNAVANIVDRFEVPTLADSLYNDLRDRYRAKFGKPNVVSKQPGFM